MLRIVSVLIFFVQALPLQAQDNNPLSLGDLFGVPLDGSAPTTLELTIGDLMQTLGPLINGVGAGGQAGGSLADILGSVAGQSGNGDMNGMIQTIVGLMTFAEQSGALPTGPMVTRDPDDPWAMSRAKTCQRPVTVNFPLPDLAGASPSTFELGITDFAPFEQMLDIYREIVSDKPCDLRDFLMFRALLEGVKGDYAAATRTYEALADTMEGDATSEFGMVIRMMYPALLGLQRRNVDAIVAFEDLRLDAERFGPDSAVLTLVDSALGDLLVQRGDMAAAGVSSGFVVSDESADSLKQRAARGAVARSHYDAALGYYMSMDQAIAAVKKHTGLACNAFSAIARAQLRLGDLNAARAAVDRAIGSGSQCAEYFKDTNLLTSRPYLTRARIRMLDGHFLGAEQDFEFALAMATSMRGRGAPLTADILSSFAELRVLQGQMDDAVALARETIEGLSIWLGGEVTGAASRGHRRDVVAYQLRFVTLAMQLALHAPDHPGAQELAALAVLRIKGLQGEEDVALASIARAANSETGMLELANEISRLRGEITQYAMSASPTDTAPLIYRLNVAERALAEASPTFNRQLAIRDVNLETIQNALAAGDVLVEFQEFISKDIGAVMTGEELDQYVAVIIRKDGVRTVSLGDAASLRGLVKIIGEVPLYQKVTPNWRDQLDRMMTELGAKVHAPLDLGPADRVFLAPDGVLHAVPFHLLPRADGSLWVRDTAQSLQVLHSGRALVHQTEDMAAGIVAIGETNAGQNKLVHSREEARVAAEAFSKRYGAEERVELLIDDYATKANAVASIFAPRVLHIAAHAAFDPTKGPGGSALTNLIQFSPVSDDPSDHQLTALEIQSLNLEGTELVVLSACETGKGTIETGEGLHDLMRSFRIAGAKTTIATRRAIDDADALFFFHEFYDVWQSSDVAVEAAFDHTLRTMLIKRPDGDWGSFSLVRSAM